MRIRYNKRGTQYYVDKHGKVTVKKPRRVIDYKKREEDPIKIRVKERNKSNRKEACVGTKDEASSAVSDKLKSVIVDGVDLSETVMKRNRSGTPRFERSCGEIVAKACTKCGAVRGMEEFNGDRRSSDGRRAVCKECTQNRGRKYHEDNAERLRKYARKYYEDNAERLRKCARKHYEDNANYYRKYREENADYHRKYSRKYREENADYHRKYREDNAGEIRNYNRKYLRDNPEIGRVNGSRRRARLRLLPDDLSTAQFNDLYQTFDGKCVLTRSDEDIHMDHVIPISIGHGGTTIENMVPLRDDLNRSKNARHLFEWFEESKEHLGLSQRKFDELVAYLAEVNDMTPAEYRKYVDWCFDNPRTADEVEADNTAHEENMRLGDIEQRKEYELASV